MFSILRRNKHVCDIILIFIIIAISSIFLILRELSADDDKIIAVIKKDNKEFRSINLTDVKESYEIVVSQDEHVTILVEPKAISFINSDCTDKICIGTGKISKPGQVAVCLPTKTSITIKGEKKPTDVSIG